MLLRLSTRKSACRHAIDPNAMTFRHWFIWVYLQITLSPGGWSLWHTHTLTTYKGTPVRERFQISSPRTHSHNHQRAMSTYRRLHGPDCFMFHMVSILCTTEDRPRTDSPLAGIVIALAADGLRTRPEAKYPVTNKELAFILNFRMIDCEASSRRQTDG